ncbi:uncharacterized protein LOC126381971 isoform X2 [Pectinophora gossypiella]|uniref:uncharacterized protein LOC126381971 isoform X2 n=1 Tax=Pectinophora gossypiella TaxID=13191 RepID=UPI00214F307A|nr:uncharacterized protein LOC126381971 isoform X2 [Pectinophora gossypiella]
MEGAVLSTPNNRFRTHLKNAASALCARTLPKQRRSESGASSAARHHTYPRATPPKRAAIACRMEPPLSPLQVQPTLDPPEPVHYQVEDVHTVTKLNGVVKLKGTLAREVASAWGCRVGQPDEPAPADRVQSLFNDIELYPTKTQVFEMLVCARQCARRKSLTLTFGEFCVFAAELRRCSRQARQTPTKPESPVWNVDRENRDKDLLCKHLNGSEASPPPCEVFLGGSCNPTTWRSDIAIPMLKKMGITYFNPQVDDWSTELMEVEHRAKAAARALLFVLDSETRAVAASVEAAHLAAAPRDLLLVLRPYTRHQNIGSETIDDQEYVELSRARATLQEAVERRGLPAFTDIPAALRCARAVLRGARTQPRHSLGHTILRLKRAYDAAGGRASRLPRPRALDALRDVAKVRRDVADRCLPPTADTVDFETFCAAVAELAADSECQSRPVQEADAGAGVGAVAVAGAEADERPATRDSNGLHAYNARLRAYGRKLGLIIPKNGTRTAEDPSGTGTAGVGAGSGSSAESVFTPGTERRLERLPAMLGAPTHDVYLGGSFPTSHTRPEEILRREGFTYVIPRANDYTRMFSCGGRRAAPPHPESPPHDKKPRPAPACADQVELRDRSAAAEPTDRLSASDFYTVTEDKTPQPFKGTYDEDLLLGSRVLVFSMSADAPCFAAMVLAAHYMGLRPNNTVLLVQTMRSPAQGTHNYSEAAVKDYNRGRHYLTDLARRGGVPVFDNVDDTVACVVARLRTL